MSQQAHARMRNFTVSIPEDVCTSLVEGYKKYLTSDGGITTDEAKDYDITAVLNYAVYAHSEMIAGGITLNADFKETTINPFSQRIEEASDLIVDEMSDPLWDIKAEVFERLKKANYYSEDAEGPDHEDELIKIMIQLVEKF